MKKIYSAVLILLSITLHRLNALDNQDWQEFQQKFPAIAATIDHNRKVLAELEETIDDRMRDIFENTPKRVESNIKKNNMAVQGITALIPVAAAAGIGIRSVDWKSLIKQLTKQAIINGTIHITCSAIEERILPECLQQYTSAQVPMYGSTMYIDVRNILRTYAYHIEEHGLELSPSNIKKLTASVVGSCVGNVYKNNSNHILYVPGTQFIFLRDNQGVRIASRSAGHLIAQGAIPNKEDAACEIAKNTIAEVSYNGIAQLLHVIARRFEMQERLELFVPQDCNPQNIYQQAIKMGIHWLVNLGMSGEFNFNGNLEKTNLSGCS